MPIYQRLQPLFLSKNRWVQECLFFKGYSLCFCPKMDGFKNANFSKVKAFAFALKSMGPRMLIFERLQPLLLPKNRWVQECIFIKGYSLCFCPKIDGSKNAYFSKAIAFAFTQKSTGPRMPIFQGLQPLFLSKNRWVQECLFFKGYRLCFCPKMDGFKNANFSKVKAFAFAQKSMDPRMPIYQRLQPLFLSKNRWVQECLFFKGYSLCFCPKIDGSKNAYFSKAIAFAFAQKSMGPRMPTLLSLQPLFLPKNRRVQECLFFKDYSLCFCPKIDGSKNAYFSKAIAFASTQKSTSPRMPIFQRLQPLFLSKNRWVQECLFF